MIRATQQVCRFFELFGWRSIVASTLLFLGSPIRRFLLLAVTFLAMLNTAYAGPDFPQVEDKTLAAGHASLADWSFPLQIEFPPNNEPTPARIALGERLFFDTRLSLDFSTSCASCHNPKLGWSDGLATAKGLNGKTLARATPSLVNAAYGTIFMWDGRADSLEEQAMLPVTNADEMGLELSDLIERVSEIEEYVTAFSNAYRGEGINKSTLSRALAAFQRTIVSRTSRFDEWIAGDSSALSKQEVDGFAVFLDPSKGNCAVCHAGANFTDDSFHNIGLGSFADPVPDIGRYAEKPVRLMRGAFKTPTLREIGLTAPYFHDGSASTLEEVVDLYEQGGKARKNLSPEIKTVDLSDQEKKNLIAFLKTLTSNKLGNPTSMAFDTTHVENSYE